jgi:hypothetical protein
LGVCVLEVERNIRMSDAEKKDFWEALDKIREVYKQIDEEYARNGRRV